MTYDRIFLQRYAQLDLEDLHDNESSAGILLDMQDRERYFEGLSTDASKLAANVSCLTPLACSTTHPVLLDSWM